MGDSNVRHFIEGERIYFREVRPSDVNENYYRWMNDPEVTRYMESRFYPNSLEELRRYVEDKSKDRDNIFLAIVLKNGDRHIGNIKLGPINWIHRFAEISLVIGEKELWGKGYASEVIKLVTDYAFEMLDLHKVTAGAYSTNDGSIRAFEKAGFEREGIWKKQYFFKGNYVDRICLGKIRSSITKNEA